MTIDPLQLVLCLIIAFTLGVAVNHSTPTREKKGLDIEPLVRKKNRERW
jgi:hypothetical protein